MLFYSVGTSGDTGSAAINAVKSKRWIDIVVLYPKVAKFLMCPIIVRFGKFYPFSSKEEIHIQYQVLYDYLYLDFGRVAAQKYKNYK